MLHSEGTAEEAGLKSATSPKICCCTTWQYLNIKLYSCSFLNCWYHAS